MQKPPRISPWRLLESIIVKRRFSVLGRPGSDLLSQVLRLSTIGAEEFNGRVRDGIGFRLPAKTTKPAKDRNQRSVIRTRESGPITNTEFEASQSTVNAQDRCLITDY